MYCKHCGKEIADDSKFCQHCGGKLDAISSVPIVVSEPKNKEGIVTTKDDESSTIKFIAKNKVYIVLYVIWIIINSILLLQGEEKVYGYLKANEIFYPFTSIGNQTSFNVKYYDWTEFLVYCLLLPLIVYTLVMIWKSSIGESVKKWLKRFGATEQNKSEETSSKFSINNIIVEEEIRKEEVSAAPITNETPTQAKNGFGYNNNDDGTWDGFFEFIVAAIKIIGAIFISLLVLLLCLMYLHAFFLGCVLSIASGILTFCLIKKYSRKYDETTNESKDEKNPLYFLGILLFFIILLLVCINNKEKILKHVNTASPTSLENFDDYKGTVEKKSNKPNKQRVRTNNSHNNDRMTLKDLDSQIKMIDTQMKMWEEEEINNLPSEYDNYFR